MATQQKHQAERRPEGKGGAGAQQEGRNSQPAGQTNRQAVGKSQKQERGERQSDGRADNADRHVSQNVTTNPRDVGAGGGSTPLGERGQDSRTWTVDDRDENDQKGGDRSNRAATSGATGERSTSGGHNKPRPKDPDEKGMGHLRNR